MLSVIALDLQQEQSKSEQTAKSKGLQQLKYRITPAQQHGVGRFNEGFSIIEVAAEYRALRASVTKTLGKCKKSNACIGYK